MAFACPICSERLEKLPAEAQGRGGPQTDKEVNISATPCGHIFHSYCIQKWLTGNLASSKQCPCCRKDVPKLRCLALFPNVSDDSILDDSMSQASSGIGGSSVSVQPCNHGEVISSLSGQIKRLNGDLDESKKLYDLLSEDYNSTLDKFRTEKLSSDMWMMKAKQFESYKDLANEASGKAKSLEQKLKCYTAIETAVKGVDDTVREDLEYYPPTLESVKTLLEVKHVLSAELRSSSKKLTETKNNYESVRSEKMKLRVLHDKTVQELKELKHIYEISRANGRLSSISPSAPHRGAEGNTPSAFRITKRRFQEPLSKTLSEQALSTTPGVDSDVDVFPSLVKAKKQKLKSSNPQSKTKSVKVQSASVDEETPSCSKATKFFAGGPGLTPIVNLNPSQARTNNATINLCGSDDDDDTSREFFEATDDEDDDFKIKGSVPGAPLPVESKRLKNLQEQAERPVLGRTLFPTVNPKKVAVSTSRRRK